MLEFNVFDTETYGDLDSAFKFGCTMLADGTWQLFLNRTEMYRYMVAQGGIWYAHNLDFDLSKLLSIHEISKKEHFLGSTNKILFLRDGDAEFRDSYALLPTSLANLGAKLETPRDLLRKKKLSLQEVVYCTKDCYVLRDAIENFMQELNLARRAIAAKYGKNPNKTKDLEKIKYTIGSQMQRICQGIYDPGYWCKDETKRKVKSSISANNEIMSASYYGGRTENYIVGVINGPLTYWDVNSLYPSVIREFLIGNPEKMEYHNIGRWVRYNPSSYHGAYGAVYLRGRQTGQYPVLPMRIDGKLIFPTGKIEGWYQITLVNYAIEHGYLHDVQIKEDCWTTETITFKPVVDVLYARRKELKELKDPKEQIIKLMLNSGLYGKYGEMHGTNKFIHFDDADEYEDFIPPKHCNVIWEDDERLIKQIKNEKGKERETAHTAFAICAQVTAYGQELLHRYIMSIVDGGYNIYYIDTDSCVTDAPPDFFEGNLELGEMKLEAIIDTIWIMAPKCYMYRGYKDGEVISSIRHKGVRDARRIEETITIEHIRQYYRYTMAMRNGIDMMQRRVAKKDREHNFFLQKRDIEGEIMSCKDYYVDYMLGKDNYVKTKPKVI